MSSALFLTLPLFLPRITKIMGDLVFCSRKYGDNALFMMWFVLCAYFYIKNSRHFARKRNLGNREVAT